MTSRAEILARIKGIEQPFIPLPAAMNNIPSDGTDLIEKFSMVLSSIGGAVVKAADFEGIRQFIQQEFKDRKRIISTLPELKDITEAGWEHQDPHGYENVELAILKAHFGVAENAALWITEELMQQRVVPFICEQLAVVVKKEDILATMHEAYDRIGDAEYGFGAFIAGPSKTADIEQSLVLGAHGPKAMTVFLLG